jgi:hypothetical protein
MYGALQLSNKGNSVELPNLKEEKEIKLKSEECFKLLQVARFN